MVKKYFVLSLIVPLCLMNLASADFNVSCNALLTGSGGIMNVGGESPSFSNSVSGFANSRVTIPLGDYQLSAAIDMNQPYGSSSLEPTLSMSLIKGGNPIQGQVNFARAQGLDLDHRASNQPLTLFGVNFLSFTYDGKLISRVDYNCSVVKLP